MHVVSGCSGGGGWNEATAEAAAALILGRSIHLWRACQAHLFLEPDLQESMSHSCPASTTSVL